MAVKYEQAKKKRKKYHCQVVERKDSRIWEKKQNRKQNDLWLLVLTTRWRVTAILCTFPQICK